MVLDYLRAAIRSNDLRALREMASRPEAIEPPDLAGCGATGPMRRVPLINRVQAGAPGTHTDLGYPAGAADDYVLVPAEFEDPDMFAARVTGESMAPEYNDGDVIVMSPRGSASIKDGTDCFARLNPDQDTTFKRVYREDDGDGLGRVRLQPINPAYPPKTVPTEEIAGLFPVVYHIRKVRPR